MTAYQGYKITDFPDLLVLLGGEYFPVVYGTNYKVTLDQIKAYVAASGVTGPGSAINGNLASFSGTTGKVIQDTGTALSSLATLASPTFTGAPLVPTAANNVTNTQAASTAYVDNRLKAYPTFRARKSATQSITNSTSTVITFNTIDWNVGTGYSSGTNRFAPQVAGYYSVQATVAGVPSAGTLSVHQAELTKNGVTELFGEYLAISGAAAVTSSLSGMVFMNGTTDYLQVRAFSTTSGGASTTISATTETYFCASLVVPS